jgi:hypothetical protein
MGPLPKLPTSRHCAGTVPSQEISAMNPSLPRTAHSAAIDRNTAAREPARARRSYIDLEYARFPAKGGFLDRPSYRVPRYADFA